MRSSARAHADLGVGGGASRYAASSQGGAGRPCVPAGSARFRGEGPGLGWEVPGSQRALDDVAVRLIKCRRLSMEPRP